ncbi:MAG: hypothetical protein GDA38_15000 [Hormoscilla sp. SP12CHS1]|nr:hypothetical protein [Hormoscilla sp. SP12CHS1]
MGGAFGGDRPRRLVSCAYERQASTKVLTTNDPRRLVSCAYERQASTKVNGAIAGRYASPRDVAPGTRERRGRDSNPR